VQKTEERSFDSLKGARFRMTAENKDGGVKLAATVKNSSQIKTGLIDISQKQPTYIPTMSTI